MSKKSTVPDAWDDDWEAAADTSSSAPVPPLEESSQKKVSSRANKAQRRAQQAEFNRQLWQEAEGPKETFHFLETRPAAAVPLKQDFKPPPILLSRKGPVTQQSQRSGGATLAEDVNNLSLRNKQDESSDDESTSTPAQTLEERKAQAAKEREQKQRKYEERREQLFGPSAGAAANAGSGASSPSDLTPPSSRSGTPNKGRGGGRGARGSGNQSRNQSSARRDAGVQKKELFDPTYSPKPDSIYLMRKEAGTSGTRESSTDDLQPLRAPKGPDGSGRGGFGFGTRGEKVS